MSMPTQDEANKWAMMEDEIERLRAQLKECLVANNAKEMKILSNRDVIEEQNGQLALMRGVLERQRNVIIEECARVAEEWPNRTAGQIAAAIRALKDKP